MTFKLTALGKLFLDLTEEDNFPYAQNQVMSFDSARIDIWNLMMKAKGFETISETLLYEETYCITTLGFEMINILLQMTGNKPRTQRSRILKEGSRVGIIDFLLANDLMHG
jgi:hypothetical protein